ncbi:MAG: transposase, partial [Ruthenibacterium sp.]
NPQFLKMKVAKNIKQASVKAFAQQNIVKNTTIHSDGYRSYKAALTDYDHKPTAYDPHSGLLHWLHVAVSNAKAFVLGTYHGLPAENLNEYLAEYCFRFSRRKFHGLLFDRLAIALAASSRAYAKG